MSGEIKIQPSNVDRLDRYAEIYAAAFSQDPWNNTWEPEDARTHIKELLELKQFYGLDYIVDGEVAGIIMGFSKMFDYGRSFEIDILAVDPAYQKRGIATELLERLLADVKEQGIVGAHLITAAEGSLPSFYGRHGFKNENKVILMEMDL